MSVVKLTYHSHACFSISVGGTEMLIDPFLSGNDLADVSAQEVAADYILVSHRTPTPLPPASTRKPRPVA